MTHLLHLVDLRLIGTLSRPLVNEESVEVHATPSSFYLQSGRGAVQRTYRSTGNACSGLGLCKSPFIQKYGEFRDAGDHTVRVLAAGGYPPGAKSRANFVECVKMLTLIDGILLYGLCNKLMDGHIHYGFGSKTALTSRPEDITSIDCSGLVRYLMYQASSASLRMPDGSVVQNEWCQHQQLPLVNYGDAARHDQLIRIAFLPPHHGHAGHVWLIHQSRTLESHTGRGPDRRIWNTPVLFDGVRQCYELAIVPLVGDFTLHQYNYA